MYVLYATKKDQMLKIILAQIWVEIKFQSYLKFLIFSRKRKLLHVIET